MKAASSAVIGLDIGTSVVKGVLVGADGRLIARAARSQPLDFGPGGRVEVDAVVVARNARRVIGQLASRAARAGLRVRAVCAGGSGDEAVWVDGDGVPVARVPSSLDIRDTTVSDAIVGRVGAERFRALTGLPTAGSYPITRYAALRAARPDLAARVQRLLAWPEALALDLGVDVTGEPTLAARTGAWWLDDGAERGRYDVDLLAAAGVTAELFPPVGPTGSVIGTILPRVAATIGLPLDVSLVAGGFDQAMATLGAQISTTGIAHVGAGSWQALTVLADERPTEDLVADGFSIGPSIAAGGRWSAMASGPGTITLGWLGRVGGGASDPVKRITELARRAADEPTGLAVIPDLGGGAPPHPDPQARGLIAGLGLGDGADRVARALLEGVAIGLRERLTRAAAAGLAVGEIRATGGGARDPLFRRVTADVTGLPVRPVYPADAGAIAAAALAMTAVELAPDVASALGRTVRIGRPIVPRATHHAAYVEVAERVAVLRSSIATVQRTDADT
ncbi:MAG TPA: FGGY family carbohydrate kinase [Candidatus Limnocylindrales bacterium]|nr:FGGY family carbohydrate kinase [Candidatus Limnocylindrales bacterium]